MKNLDRKKVVLGMSGGVDSSVAALLLQQQGYQVFGVSMQLYSCDRPLAKGCCTPSDRLDARQVCEKLEIPFDIIDLRENFQKKVIHYFVSEYSHGRTPLPCAPCNKEVRFSALLDYADQIGAYWIASGHYAQIRRDDRSCLVRAKDLRKDQSYFLWPLGEKELSRLLFPIGAYRKEEVRSLAKKFALPVWEKPDSQDLCFVGAQDHAQFLEEHFPDAVFADGNFVNEEGKKVGRHHGVHAYTVGQRRGLGIGFGERRYVVALNAEKNEVVLGPKNSLMAAGLIAKDVHWIDSQNVDGEMACLVKIRSTHLGVMARVQKKSDGADVVFETPQYAVTPGQAAVFYRDDVCIGGGWIERALS